MISSQVQEWMEKVSQAVLWLPMKLSLNMQIDLLHQGKESDYGSVISKKVGLLL